jgi:hypothetical protein
MAPPNALVTVLVALLLAGAAAAPRPSFDDVPPCHWAAEAVADLDRLGIFIGFPADAGYESVNAVRQVFEGLRCGDPAWSLRFVRAAPAAFGLQPRVVLVAFALEADVEAWTSVGARIAYSLTTVTEEDGVRRSDQRAGHIEVVRDPFGWRVDYAALAGLELPLFR